jgi:hypothetical protein
MFENFSDQSRVWVYPSSRALNEQDKIYICEQLDNFILKWNAHGAPIKGSYQIFDNHFIVLVADESHSQVSGCSIDSSVKCLKSIGYQLNIDFFNRLTVIIEKDSQIQRVSFVDLKCDASIWVFDTSISTLAEFKSSFKVPVENYLDKLVVR